MLSSLVHEANFLVEDNLGLLVEEEDLPEGERNLFKLDSILNIIGLQGEKALFKLLKQHEKNPSKAMDSILKVIRSQVESRKREKEQNVMLAAGGSLSQSTRSGGGKSCSFMSCTYHDMSWNCHNMSCFVLLLLSGAYGGMSSTGKTEDGQTTQYSGAMNEWALVEARLGNKKTENS